MNFITEGHFGRHLRRMREVYAERLSVLLESARERLAGLLEISSIEAGLQTVGWLQGAMDGEAAAEAAAKRDVEVMPLSRYSRGKMAREGLQLGFAAVDAREIRRGVEELAIALERFKAGRWAGKQGTANRREFRYSASFRVKPRALFLSFIGIGILR